MKQSDYNKIIEIFNNEDCNDCPYRKACDAIEELPNYSSLCSIILNRNLDSLLEEDNDSLVSYSKSIKFIQENVGNSLAAEYHKMFNKQ